MKKHYLGDGLYASNDGFQFILTAPRGVDKNDDHYVCLEPDTLDTFLRYVEKICNVKITVTPTDQAKPSNL